MTTALVNDLGPFQRLGDVRADVLPSHMLLEFRLMHELSRLRPGAAQDQTASGGVEVVREVFERKQAGRVDGRHVAQTKNHDWRKFFDMVGYRRQFLGRAKQERA